MSSQRSHQGAGRRSVKPKMDELVNMVDEHLAWQSGAQEHRLQKQDSASTLIVDWDGTGEPVVSYRRSHDAMVTEPLSRRVEVGHSVQPRRAPRASQPTPQPQYVSPPAPLLTSKGKGKAPQRYDSAHGSSRTASQPPATFSSRTRPIRSPQTTPRQPRKEPTFAYGYAPPNHKSSHTSAYPIPPRTRALSTAVQCHRDASPSSSSSSSSSAMQMRYSPSQHIVTGFDPASKFEYDYNGRVVHVHRDQGSQESGVSEYFNVPAESYAPDVPVVVVDQPLRGSGVRRDEVKVHMVVNFVQKVLRKLEEAGVMGKFWQQRARRSRG